MEKSLYKLFMILSEETAKSKIRLIEKRLWFPELPKLHKLKLNTFGNRQGLIQIQHDYCRKFLQGCIRCERPKL